MFDNVRQDLQRALQENTGQLFGELLNPGTQAVLIHRFGHWSLKLRVPILRHLLLLVHLFLDFYARAVVGIYIALHAEIGPGLVIHTWTGIFVPPIRIGRDAVLNHGVVINWHCLGIGDDVVLGPGCKIGHGVRIGNRARVGQNAVVTSDVPDGATVLTNPPRTVTIEFPPKPRLRESAGAAKKSPTD